MSEYRFAEGLYLAPTPAGAFLAASRPGNDASRRLLLRLLGRARTPVLGAATVARLAGIAGDDAGELLQRLQSLALVQGLAAPRDAPEAPLQEFLPPLLQRLSGAGRCVLADSQGLYLAASGYPHETAEELSALGAGIAGVRDRHARLLEGNLALSATGWGVVDASGNSQLGFWPLHLGPHAFVLAVGGVPRFNTPEFLTLAWALTRRYAPDNEP
jgi:hypothetical protein